MSEARVPVKKRKCMLETLLGDMFHYGDQPVKPNALDAAKSEIKAYIDEPSVPLDTNPLVWWKQAAYKFPLLSKLAIDTLVVQGTSVPSERIFSTAGDVISKKRSMLTGDHVNEIIFLNRNQDLINF